jgi:hypothetical protein
LSPKAFTQDFREFREQGAKQVTVKRYPAGSYERTHFECQSSDRTRTVKLVGSTMVCECEDYSWQSERFGMNQAECKHIIAVQQFLGKESLEQQVLKSERITCRHERAIPGVDAVYCPECKESFDWFHPTFDEVMARVEIEQQAKRDLFGEAA